MPFMDSIKEDILNAYVGREQLNVVGAVFEIALFLSSSTPATDGTGTFTEPSSSAAYGRELIGAIAPAATYSGSTQTNVAAVTAYNAITKCFGAPAVDSNGNVYVTNTVEIKFDHASADWGTIGYFGLCKGTLGTDSNGNACCSNGELYAYGTFVDSNGNDTTITVESGQAIHLLAGECKLVFA